LPNALVGTLAIYTAYLLVREILKYINIKGRIKIKPELVALTAAFLLAISPWNIMMSRGAFEANFTTLLLPLAMYLFIRGLKNPKYFIYQQFRSVKCILYRSVS
jgi:4-amino-4-deoxy-L-arabinose transferase-like glycosyltransferase